MKPLAKVLVLFQSKAKEITRVTAKARVTARAKATTKVMATERATAKARVTARAKEVECRKYRKD